MARYLTLVQAWAATPLVWCAVASGATQELRLEIFGDQPSPHGLWKTELLEASDQELMANAKAMSTAAVCMDAAADMARNVKPSESACTLEVVKNTRTVAQIEKECPEGPRTVMTMTRESRDSILFESVEKGKAGVISTMKGRYRYAGACNPEDGLMKLDKDSETCQRIRTETAEMSVEAACGKVEGAQKADCVRRVESTRAKIAKMCE